MKTTFTEKNFEDLFVEDKKLENEAENVENKFTLDWEGYGDEQRLIKKTKRNITEENFGDIIYWFVESAFSLGRSYLNDKLDELFNNNWGGRYSNIDDDKNKLTEAIIDYADRQVRNGYWDFENEITTNINELIRAWNYSLVHYRLGQSWAFEFGRHSDYEIISEFDGTGIDESGDVKKLLKTIDNYDWKKDDDKFIEYGREALEGFLDDLDDDEELRWESICEDGWTNMFHVERALKNDDELFLRVYNKLDEEGKEIFKDDYLKKFVEVDAVI